MYVADMPKHVKYCKLQQYADDSQIYLSFPENQLQDAQGKFNRDLENINKFAQDHNLKLNPSKSWIIFLGAIKAKLARISDNFNAHINDIRLPIVSEVKNLGIFLDS